MWVHSCPGIGGFSSALLSQVSILVGLCLHLLPGHHTRAPHPHALLDLGVLVVLQVLHHDARASDAEGHDDEAGDEGGVAWVLIEYLYNIIGLLYSWYSVGLV
jgi:hypothetical protein